MRLHPMVIIGGVYLLLMLGAGVIGLMSDQAEQLSKAKMQIIANENLKRLPCQPLDVKP